jgi:hypothetical protein
MYSSLLTIELSQNAAGGVDLALSGDQNGLFCLVQRAILWC